MPPTRYDPPRQGEILHNYVSIARAEKYLKFSPVTDPQAGLHQTWGWFQEKTHNNWLPDEMGQDVSLGGVFPREPMGAGFQTMQFRGSFTILSFSARTFWVPPPGK